MSSRVEFINSLADAKALAIYDENKRSLIALPLSMKDSEDAIKAVANCVRDHSPNSPPEAKDHPESSKQNCLPELPSSSRLIVW